MHYIFNKIKEMDEEEGMDFLYDYIWDIIEDNNKSVAEKILLLDNIFIDIDFRQISIDNIFTLFTGTGIYSSSILYGEQKELPNRAQEIYKFREYLIEIGEYEIGELRGLYPLRSIKIVKDDILKTFYQAKYNKIIRKIAYHPTNRDSRLENIVEIGQLIRRYFSANYD